MIRNKGTLSAQFTALILIILIVGQGMLYTWLLLYQKKYLAGELKENVEAIGKHAAEMTLIIGSEQMHLTPFMESLLRNEHILSIKVADKEGKTIISISKEMKGKSDNGFSLYSIFYIPAESSISVPISHDAASNGKIEITYSGHPVNKVMKRFLIIPPVMQIITFILIVFAIVRFFNSRVSTPIRKINHALGMVTAGDLTIEVPEIGSSEIGSIARGFKFLIERLSSTITRLNSLSGNVATAMGQLTVTLRNVSESARKQSNSINEIISSMRTASESQKKITENTDKLSGVSSENVSSLLEMKATADEIASSTQKLFKSTEDSYAMVSEMSSTVKAIAENANAVSYAVENTSVSAEEISASLNAVKDNSKRSAELAFTVRELLTDRGTLAIADAIESMEHIADKVNRTSDIIIRLDERSKGIEKVLSVIKDVTEKTNLLSLNAAILAAQAGEYGKSFSVVADEIKGLSDRTSSSAKEISTIVKTIQGEIHEAVKAITVGVGKVNDGKDLIFRAGEAIGETLEAAQQSAKMAKVIQGATEEQADGLRHITLMMENVRQMIEQVAKATNEQGRSSGFMLDSISDIKEVAEFVKRGTEEHAKGTDIISRNLELTSGMVSQINQSAINQLTVNKGIAEAIEQIKSMGGSTVTELEELTISFDTLRKEIDILKNEVDAFKLDNSKKSKDRTG